MAKVTVKDLLEAGVHFGHQVKRWNPKMKEFVYGAKNGIYIIDLTKTMRQMAAACNFLQRIVADGGDVLFVGTKRQAQQIVKDVADKTNMFYVSERWLGGTLTNNVTIRQSISKMVEIDKKLESKDAASMKKKEISALRRQSMRLHRNLDGIFKMKKLPQVLVVVDVCHEDIAVKEANKLNIPVVALVDTNGNPENIDYPIPANDDAVRSIQVILEVFAEAVKISAELYTKRVAEEKAAAEAKRAEEKAAKEKAAKEKQEANKEKEAEKKKPAKKKKPAAKKPVEAKEAAPKAEEAKEAAPKAEAGKEEAPKKPVKRKTTKKAAPKKEAEKAVEAKEETPKAEEAPKAEEVKEEKTA